VETLDIQDVARVLRISVRTAKNRIAGGLPMPPHFVVGRKRLFLRDQVEAWLRQLPGATLGTKRTTRTPNRRSRR
jgi:excisionase family DNA binding protein